MKNHEHNLRVPGTPKGLEIDPEAGAVYIRYSNEKVKKTTDISRGEGVFNIDFDAKNNIVGIEMVGFATINIHAIERLVLQHTKSEVNLSRAPITMPELCPA